MNPIPEVALRRLMVVTSRKSFVSLYRGTEVLLIIDYTRSLMISITGSLCTLFSTEDNDPFPSLALLLSLLSDVQ